MGDAGLPLKVLQAYASRFTLPLTRNKGKVSDRYFKDELMSTDHVRHFADDVLGMVRILYAFLMDKAAVRDFITADHVECFSALHRIIDTLRTSGNVTDAVRTSMEHDISIHNRLFVNLYGAQHAKIKFHHLFHLPGDVAEMGACVSCFPTERKNKDALQLANASDREMQRDATLRFIHRSSNAWGPGGLACTEEAMLVDAKMLSTGEHSFSHSNKCVCPTGTLQKGDFVFVAGGIASIVDFYGASNNEIVARVKCHSKSSGTVHYHTDGRDAFCAVQDLGDACFYYKSVETIVAV